MNVQQRMNNQPAFGARNVTVDKHLYELGKETIQAVKDALPTLRKLGDDKTELRIHRELELCGDFILPTGKIQINAGKYSEPKTKFGKWLENHKLRTFINWHADKVMDPPTKKSEVVALAKSTVKDMEAKIKENEKISIANSSQARKEAKMLMDELQQEIHSK